MHYRWLEDHIAENRENDPWVNRVTIYKHTLKFVTKSWWSVLRYYTIPAVYDNTLGATNVSLVATFMVELELNILKIIMEDIRDKGGSLVSHYHFYASSPNY